MATFTIDLLTGNLYLFSGNFSGSGSTPTSGSTYPQVNLYSDLPSAGSVAGQIYVVRTGSGAYVLNRKPSGFYFSTGAVWRFLGDTPDFFKSNNFQIYDSVDTTKGVMFTTSGISTNTFRKLKVQNSDGTIAYLTDLNTKLDTSAFNDYTGTTAPATYLTKTAFNTFTGTTLPANYYNKTQINSYTGQTLLLINGKQNTLVAGTGISIVGNTISVTGSTPTSSYSALQLIDTVGGVNVNVISATTITWTQEFTGTSLNFSGGSRIYIQSTDRYEISYALNTVNNTGSAKNIGSLIRKNGNTDITPMSSSSFSQNLTNDSATNIMPSYIVLLAAGSYIELKVFRIGNAGNVLTVQNGSWLKIRKI
jgi:hypothetical protein